MIQMKSSEILLQFALWNCRFWEIASILLGFYFTEIIVKQK